MESGLDLWPWALGAVAAFAAFIAGLLWRGRVHRRHLPQITARIDGAADPAEFEIEITIRNIFGHPILVERVRAERPSATLITDVQEWQQTAQGRIHRPRFTSNAVASRAVVPAAEPGFDGTLRQAVWARPPRDWNRRELILKFSVTISDPISRTLPVVVAVGIPEEWGRGPGG